MSKSLHSVIFSSLLGTTTSLVSLTSAAANPLVDQQTWLGESGNSQTYCSDIVAANQASQQANYEASNVGTVSNLPLPAQNNWQQNLQTEQQNAIVNNVAVGKNCDFFTTAASQRDQSLFQGIAQIEATRIDATAQVQINYEQQVTQRLAIQSQEKIQRLQIEKEAQLLIFQTLLQNPQ